MRGDRARSVLQASRFADVRWVPETTSTNADLLAVARAGGPAGTVLVADHQLGGRGRLDRVWEAPPDSSLLCSILLRPDLAPAQAPLVAWAVALAAADACRDVAQVEPLLKWPNDLLLADASGRMGKVAGVLSESIVEGDQLLGVVVGIGLNVNWPDELPPGLEDVAIALNHVVGHTVDREDLLIGMLWALERWVDRLDQPDGALELIGAYAERCATIGERVRVEQTGGSFEGTATGISDEGHLLVDPADGGDQVEVTVGDVVHLHHR